MSLIAPIKDHHSEKRLFISRIILAVVVSILLLGIVVARLVQLQVRDYELFMEKSQGNRVRLAALPPTRGLIYDRRGRVLAEEPARLSARTHPGTGTGPAGYAGPPGCNWPDPE